MISQMSRFARVKATFNDDEDLEMLNESLEPAWASIEGPKPELTGKEQAEFMAKGSVKLSQNEYDSLLWYLRGAGRPYFSVHSSAQKMANADTLYLPPYVRKRTEVHISDHTFSVQRSHEGNSAVQFFNPRSKERETGYIEDIWTIPLESRTNTFFVIRPHRRLSEAEERKAPFVTFNEKYAVRIVDCIRSDQSVIVEQQHIITHLATYRRPANTFGIPRETLIVCWALNRGRR